MLKEHYNLFKRLHLLCDLLVVAAVYPLLHVSVFGGGPAVVLEDSRLWIFLVVLALVLDAGTQSYEFRFRPIASSLGILARRWGTTWLIVLSLSLVMPGREWSRADAASFAGVGLAALWATHILTSLALRWWRRRGRAYRTALIVGTGTSARRLVDDIVARPELGIHPIGFLEPEILNRLWRYRDVPLRGSLTDLPNIVKSEQVDYALFCLDPDQVGRLNGTLGVCTQMGVKALFITDWFDAGVGRKRVGEFLGRPGIIVETVSHPVHALLLKWTVDRILAAIGIVIAAPVMMAVALAVKLTSPGPVLFRQVRLGRNGRRFTMLKFRTMVADAEALKPTVSHLNEMSGPVFKIAADPRVTPIGRFLRRLSLDELPQLVNVLKGDMSLVGPRPPLPEEVRGYDGWERRRLAVKPGITCLWQIRGRNEIDFEDWMRLDMQYIDNWSMKGDAEILLKTIPAVLRRTGAR